ncbi:hypothetical protein HWV62_5159 [Athelia sp. TMB]|nr:hypothetical protein HWV62_5159 [Athelia sp. TMB]
MQTTRTASISEGEPGFHLREYASWTLAERVMMDPLNEDATDGILDRVEIADAMALGATCKRAQSAWLFYRRKVFNMNKFLTVYMPNADAFRQAMASTAAVVSGRCITEMLRRNNPAKWPLTIVIGGVQSSVMRQHLEQVQGFEARSESAFWRENRAIGQWATVRGIRASRIHLRSAFISRRATKSQEFPFREMLTLEKTGSDGHTRYIVLQVAKKCISKTFMSPGTTACANVMSHNALVAFYPRATFVENRNYRIYRPPYVGCRTRMDLLPFDLSFHERATNRLDDGDYYVLKVVEGKNPVRTIGDPDCWTMAYDGDGNNTDCYSTVADTKNRNELEGNRWRLRVEGGRISTEVEAARRSDFDTDM